MDLSRCRIISTVEIGSTFQGTADEQSDVDAMTIVVQPLQDVIFRNHEKSAVHKNDVRYYPVERFIRLIKKVSFDSMLILSAQLVQAEGTRFNKEVLHHFYDDHNFKRYVLANLTPLGYSLIGNLNPLMKQAQHQSLDGKKYIKLLTFSTHLRRVLQMIDWVIREETLDYINIGYKEIAKVSLPESDIKRKRLSTEAFYNEIPNTFDFEVLGTEHLIEAFLEKIKHPTYLSVTSEYFKDTNKLFTQIEKDATRFLVNEYIQVDK